MRAPLKTALASWAPSINIIIIIITNEKTPLNSFCLAFLGSSSVVFSHDVLRRDVKEEKLSAEELDFANFDIAAL